MVSNISFPEEGLSPLGGFPGKKKTFDLKGKFNLLSIKRRKVQKLENYNFFPFIKDIHTRIIYIIYICKIFVSGLTESRCVLLLLFGEVGKHVLSWESWIPLAFHKLGHKNNL